MPPLLWRGFIKCLALILVGGAVAACSGHRTRAVQEMPPDRFGWVVSWSQSPDYSFSIEHSAVESGSVSLKLQDGSVVVADAATEVESACRALLPANWQSQPCWVHVGLTDNSNHAGWIRPFTVRDWEGNIGSDGTPLPDSSVDVGINHNFVSEHDGTLVLSDGTVLPFDRGRVEAVCDSSRSVDDLLTGYGTDGLLFVIVDPATGAVSKLDCYHRA